MNRIYNHRNAAKFLGVHPNTLMERVKRGLITPEKLRNGDRIYTEDDLKDLQRKVDQGEGEFTIRQIAVRFGLDYFKVYRAFRANRKVQPVRVIGKTPLYGEDQVMVVAEQEEWNELGEAITE